MWRNSILVLVIAFVHFLSYIGLFGMAFAIGDSGQSVPPFLGISITILGAPLMFLMYLPPTSFGPTRWWGDDSNFIFLLAAANALLWGIELTALIRYGQSRRKSRA